MLEYFVLASIALIAIAIAGIISERHFVAVMLAIELIFISSTVLLVSFFSLSGGSGADAFLMLTGIWSVAAVEVIALVTFYICMKSLSFDFDITKLSKLKW